MHQEKNSIKWQNYSDHLRSMMKELLMNEDFADVTIVTEDKKQIKANISVLSACSPVFKDILKKEKSSSPIMYLRGIQYSEMESIIQFIYLGQATFYKDKMDEFLAVAKSLEIKALCNAPTPTYKGPKVEPLPSDQGPSTKVKKQTSDPVIELASQDKEGGVASVNRKFECEQCHIMYSSRKGFLQHKQSVHQGVKHPCQKCDYRATTQSSLNKHIQSKHEGVKYACDQCDYQASDRSNLGKHIMRRHI